MMVAYISILGMAQKQLEDTQRVYDVENNVFVNPADIPSNMKRTPTSMELGLPKPKKKRVSFDLPEPARRGVMRAEEDDDDDDNDEDETKEIQRLCIEIVNRDNQIGKLESANAEKDNEILSKAEDIFRLCVQLAERDNDVKQLKVQLKLRNDDFMTNLRVMERWSNKVANLETDVEKLQVENKKLQTWVDDAVVDKYVHDKWLIARKELCEANEKIVELEDKLKGKK
jgi:hypothetical protein